MNYEQLQKDLLQSTELNESRKEMIQNLQQEKIQVELLIPNL